MKTAILFILLTSVLFAQNEGFLSSRGGKVYLGFNTGLSFPLGNFANDNPSDQNSGYANTGYILEISGGLRFLNLFELAVVGFRNSNSTDVSNLVNSIGNTIPGIEFSGDSGSWEIYGLLAGIGISFPLPEKFIGDIQILGGYQNVSSPEINLLSDSEDTFVKIDGKNISSPVYLGSGSVRYPLNAALYLSFGFHYIASSGNFENIRTTSSISGEISTSEISYSRVMDAWGLNVGLKYFIVK